MTFVQMQMLRDLQVRCDRLLKRVKVLEDHVERLESDCLPSPDSNDCRRALPPLGADSD